MADFRGQPPANTGAGTIETDPSEALFNANYVFGTRTYPIDEDPGPSSPATTSTIAPEDPIDVTTPATQEPTPAAQGGPNVGSDSLWILWPSGVSTIVVKIPNAKAVRAVWFPVVPFAIVVSPGNAPGSLLYEVTTAGAELVPIPGDHSSIALTAQSNQSAWKSLWVFVSGEDFGPSKAGGASFPGSIAQSGYDNLIIGNPTLLNYWPLADPAGTTVCADLGPANQPMLALGGMALGASGFLPNNRTCAQSNGASGTGLTAHDSQLAGTAVNVKGIISLEFWAFFPGNDANIFSSYAGPPNYSYGSLAIRTDTNNLIVLYVGYGPFATNVVCASNQTHHFVATINGQIVDLYLDGSLVYSTSTVTWQGSLDFLFIESSAGNFGNTPAKICDIATYSGVLSLSEIREHFALGIAGS